MKKKLLLGGIVLVVLAAVVGLSMRRSGGGKGTPVTLAAVKTGALSGTVRGPGTVNPERFVDISAHLPGKITRLAVREGDVVTKGQLLLELDRTQYEAALHQSAASVESQRSQVDLARAQLEKARLDLQRAEDLHRRGLSSDQDLELARTTARVEEARFQSAEKLFDQAAAGLKRAQDELDKCRYTAPMDGIVSRLNVEEGEMAVTGTMNNPGTVLLSIADLSQMEVEAEIDETDVVDVRLDQTSKIKVDAFPDSSFAGRVREIANSAVTRNRGTQEEVTNFTVKVQFEGQVPALRPGMSATVEIETAKRQSAVKLPIQAIVSRDPEKEKAAFERRDKPGRGKGEAAHAEEAEGAKSDEGEDQPERDLRVDGVYVVEDGRAVFKTVETGISDDRFIEAVSGIEAGGKVITGPYQTLRTLESGKRVEEKKESTKDKKKERT